MAIVPQLAETQLICAARALQPSAAMPRLTILLLAACTSTGPTEDGPGGKADGTDTGSTGGRYMPPTPQRAGDPAAGWQHLVSGNYFPCGVPDSVYRAADAVGLVPGDGGTTMNELGRSGRDAELPYWFTSYRSGSGVDMVTVNCLFCHGGRVDGQLIVGLGDNRQDFTYPDSIAGGLTSVGGVIGSIVLSTEASAELDRFLERFGVVGSRIQMRTRGLNPGNIIPRILGAYRSPKTLAWSSTAEPTILPMGEPAAVDVPPWWRVARKNQLYYTGEGVGDHARLLMSAAMYCADDVPTAAAFDKMFVDVVAYIKTIKPPKYPYGIDSAKASAGKTIFTARCAGCHGTYGSSPSYPNLAISIDKVGTDATLARQEASQKSLAFNVWYEQSWYGTAPPLARIKPQLMYVAPPLDGVWATAPFLHNGSVPNLETLLDSTKRPLYWTRDYASSTLDRVNIGVVYTELDHGHADALPWERDEIYDTTLPGHSADGHTFADSLSATDRGALLEYLKTL